MHDQEPSPITAATSVQMGVHMIFNGGYSSENASVWLAFREQLQDPLHTLNQSPLMPLMVLEKWLNDPEENNERHPNAQRWIEQCFQACVAWEWPTNATATELYYRLGNILRGNSRMAFLESSLNEPAQFETLLMWCMQLESLVLPGLATRMERHLQDDGIRLVSPQETVLNTLLTIWMKNPSKYTCSNMEILWRSPAIRENILAAEALVMALPRSLPAAIRHQMSCTNALRKHTEAQADYPASMFSLDPALSDTHALFNALLMAYQDVGVADMWDTITDAWPVYANLYPTLECMHGLHCLDEIDSNGMRTEFVQYLRNIQNGPALTPNYNEGLSTALDM